MSLVSVSRQTDLSNEQIKSGALEIARKLTREYGVKFFWNQNRAKINGTGVQGICDIKDGTILIQLKLGFFVAPHRNSIRKKIHDYLNMLEG